MAFNTGDKWQWKYLRSLKHTASWGGKTESNVRFGRKWPNLSLNKDFDTRTWRILLYVFGEIFYLDLVQTGKPLPKV